MRRPRALATTWLLLLPLTGSAFTVNIGGGGSSMYLQVGVGQMTGGPFISGGTPGTNPTVNSVSVTVPAASLGTGTLPMTTDSNEVNSPYNGAAYCWATNPSTWVYVGGYYRGPGFQRIAQLSVTSPPELVSGTDKLPFTEITWESAGINDASPAILPGRFQGVADQPLLTVQRNTWFQTCLRFSYANTMVFPAGTYTNRVTYTLTVP